MSCTLHITLPAYTLSSTYPLSSLGTFDCFCHLFVACLHVASKIIRANILNVLTKKLARRKSKSDVVAYIVSNYELRADTYYLESWYPGPWRRGEPTSAELYGAGLNSAA